MRTTPAVVDYDSVVDNEGKWKFNGKNIVPYFHTIQKMVLYETKSVSLNLTT